MKKLLLLFLFSLVLAACGNEKPESAGAAEAHQVHKPTLDVKLKVVGHEAHITVTTDMHISPEHYGQARHEGEGHIHLYLDGGEKIGVKKSEHVLTDLKPGKHSLKVSLHNNDHTPYDVTKTIDFEVK